MSEREQVDLTHYSFDEFISFLFAREVEVKTENTDEEVHDHWFWHIEDTFIAETICTYYIQLFRQPEFLLHRFSKAQLEEGFWAIQGANLNCAVYRICWGIRTCHSRLVKIAYGLWPICSNN